MPRSASTHVLTVIIKSAIKTAILVQEPAKIAMKALLVRTAQSKWNAQAVSQVIS